MSFIHDNLSKVTSLGYTNSVLVPQGSLVIYPKIGGFIFSRVLADFHQVLI